MGQIQLTMYPLRVLLWQPYPERLFNKCNTIKWVICQIYLQQTQSHCSYLLLTFFAAIFSPFFSLNVPLQMDVNLICLHSELDGHKLSLRWKTPLIKLRCKSEVAHIWSAYSVGSCQLTSVCRRTPGWQICITHLSFSLKFFLKVPVFHLKVFYFSLAFQLSLRNWPCNTKNSLRKAWKNIVIWSNSAESGKWHWCTTGVRKREPYFQRVSQYLAVYLQNFGIGKWIILIKIRCFPSKIGYFLQQSIEFSVVCGFNLKPRLGLWAGLCVIAYSAFFTYDLPGDF